MTYPLVLHPFDSVPGDLGDPLFVIWVLGRNLNRLLSLDLSGFWEANIFYPAPLVLAYSEHFFATTLLGLPMYLLSGSLIVTYNFLFLATFFLSGWGMYLLARDLTGNDGAAIVAGIIFAFFPFRFAHMGHLHVLTLQWVPFTFLYLNRFFSQPSYRNLFLSGFFYLLEALSCGHYALFFSLFVGLSLLWQAIARERLAGSNMMRKFVILGTCLAALTGPFFYPYIKVRKEFGFSRSLDEQVMYSARLTSYLSSSPANRVWGELTRRFLRPERQLHPGVIVLLLTLYGAALSLKARRPAASPPRGGACAVTMAALALLLSFGPLIHLLGRPVFPGPYIFLYRYVPGFDLLRVPARFAAFLMFAAAMLASHGATKIATCARTSWRKRAVTIGLAALICAEYLSVPIPLPRVPGGGGMLPVYDWLARRPGTAPVVEIPLTWGTNIEYVYFSAFHRKDLLNGYSGYAPPPYVHAEVLLQDFPSDAGIALLEELGVRYVIVHEKKLAPAARRRMLFALPRFHDRLRKVQDFGDDEVYELARAKRLSRRAAMRRWISMPKVFPGASLPSRIGRLLEDPLAEGQMVRWAEKGEAGVVTFGPYVPLPSGRYRARFLLRASPGQARRGASIGHLDVAMDAGQRPMALRELDAADFVGGSAYRELDLEFAVPPAHHYRPVECRVIGTGAAALGLARIEIWPMSVSGGG